MISVLSSSPISLEEVDQPADVMVGVLEEAGEHLHHARVELALVGGQLVPVLHVRVVARQLGVLRQMPSSFCLAKTFSR